MSVRGFVFMGILLVGMMLLAACAPQTAATDPAPLTPTAVIENNPTQAEPSAAAPSGETPAPAQDTPASTQSPVETPPDPAEPAAATASPANATSLPDVASYQWETTATDLLYPVGMAHAGDGSGRLFIISQTGLIYIYQDSQVLQTPFLDLTELVNGPQPGSFSEMGLLGLAFHPRYAENGYFYVNYTAERSSFIARYQVSADPNRADPSSRMILLEVGQPFPNHNGGALEFGPDGYLYIGLGDGGSRGDPEGRAQSLDTRLGKILRIDVDGAEPYAVPADNPFANGGGLPEIWAYGLRNPWRFSFDPLSGDFYIADVGQNQWEEVNYVPAGAPAGLNFGWDYREALHPYEGTPPAGAVFTDPVTEYSHAEGGCSVTGGVVVRDPLLPDLQGVYLYGDYCSGNVWGLWRDAAGNWQSQLMFQTGLNISSFGVGEDGRVYLANLQGSIHTLQEK
jgi:glucose/arabinose dehydrogenase